MSKATHILTVQVALDVNETFKEENLKGLSAAFATDDINELSYRLFDYIAEQMSKAVSNREDYVQLVGKQVDEIQNEIEDQQDVVSEDSKVKYNVEVSNDNYENSDPIVSKLDLFDNIHKSMTEIILMSGKVTGIYVNSELVTSAEIRKNLALGDCEVVVNQTDQDYLYRITYTHNGLDGELKVSKDSITNKNDENGEY